MVDLIIIGAGPGGYEAALYAGRKGKSVILIEKEYIGGTCLNVGCIPTKTLLHSAKIYTEAIEAHKFGINLKDPVFDMSAVVKRKNKIVGQLTRGVEASLKAAKVEIVRGEAKIVSKGKIAVDGKTYEASHILISTGSRPAKPPIPGADSAFVMDSTGILNIESIPETLTIIGGGVIGIEFASLFSSIGTKVTVIEMLDKICPGIDGEITKMLQRTLKKDGVDFFLSAKVEHINKQTVTFSQNGQLQEKAADLILMATGRTPNLEGLGLDDIKVDYDRTGLKVDKAGRTNIPGIWACGDVTGRCLLAHSATREGQVAVNNMFGEKDQMSYRAMPGVVYSHPEVASVGLTEEEAKEQNIDYKVVKKQLGIAGRFIVENEGKSGTCKVLLGKKYNEVLGVHIIGGNCSEMIWGAVTFIENEMRVNDITKIIFPHPTVSEAIKETIIH
jgi:dihydrolipoamide dehydrogenase